MAEIRSVCVFCGSKAGSDPVWAEIARDTGRLLAENGIRVIYGGGRLGLMGIVADAAIEAGGEVIGVIPDFLQAVEVAHEGIKELIVVKSMHARKNTMFDLSDGFITLPGGIGTLDETFEVLSLRLLGMHDKPIVMVDAHDYWQGLIDFIAHMYEQGFVGGKAETLYTLTDRVDEILPALEAAPEPELHAALRKF